VKIIRSYALDGIHLATVPALLCAADHWLLLGSRLDEADIFTIVQSVQWECEQVDVLDACADE
jgi:hypothetical protein